MQTTKSIVFFLAILTSACSHHKILESSQSDDVSLLTDGWKLTNASLSAGPTPVSSDIHTRNQILVKEIKEPGFAKKTPVSGFASKENVVKSSRSIKKSYLVDEARRRRDFWRKAKWTSFIAGAGLAVASVINANKADDVYRNYQMAKTPEDAEFWRLQSKKFDGRTEALGIAAGVLSGFAVFSFFMEQSIRVPHNQYNLGYNVLKKQVSLELNF